MSPEVGLIASSLIEDITIGFCAFNSLQVIAPYSAVQIGHNVETQAVFFERQSVNYVLETRISGNSDDITLFAQLIFVDDAQVLWAERFSLQRLDLLRDKRAISRQVALSARSLPISFTPLRTPCGRRSEGMRVWQRVDLVALRHSSA